jgi:hypothetical protein
MAVIVKQFVLEREYHDIHPNSRMIVFLTCNGCGWTFWKTVPATEYFRSQIHAAPHALLTHYIIFFFPMFMEYEKEILYSGSKFPVSIT